MSKDAYVGEAATLSVRSAATGLTDIELIITKPDGTDIAANMALTEIGTKKIYNGELITVEEGAYYATIVSPTDTSIDGKILQINSKPVSKLDLGGTGFNSATDSIKIISDNVKLLQNTVGGSDNGWIG